MMSGAKYNVTVCQTLQSERMIKISTILKILSSNTMGGNQSHNRISLHLSLYQRLLRSFSFQKYEYCKRGSSTFI